MPATRELKRRIKSVKNTKKITRAMQMISAVKMRKAQDLALKSRNYAEMVGEIIRTLLPKVDRSYNALLRQNKNARKVGVIVISTNRGLVGGFNANLIKEVRRYTGGLDPELVSDFFISGKKAREALARLHQQIVYDFPKQERAVRFGEVHSIAKIIIDEYLKGDYKSIVLVYTQFVSTLSQKPKIVQLLPFSSVTESKESQEAFEENTEEREEDTEEENPGKFILEPNSQVVLDSLLPRIIESQLYQAVLENDASEHSARMVMMKNATEAAGDLIDDLTLTYNQLRQANITKELAEISAGRAAIE